ncbi:hypothetical protein H5410_000698 [Solanum commersonii]|uniref:Uncharacterized protein n=1 Tax=Solanum commersonii TaxID=4109 RepID=A0A9J6AWL4_SOLCO|nr:hypothetical protein H5410_000698 [Solanum commersonii]
MEKFNSKTKRLPRVQNVRSFSSIRQDEVLHMIEFFDHLLVRRLIQQKDLSIVDSMICRSGIGKVLKDKNKLMELR